MKKATLLFGAFIATMPYLSFSQAGNPDDTFDGDGKLTTSIGTIGDQAFSAAIQLDGKIVVGGVSTSVDGDFTLVRYNEDGSLDNSFGVNGIATTPNGPGTDVIKSIAMQPDGKIIAAGYSSNGSDNDFAVARYNFDGSLDTDFGTNGIVTTVFGSSDDYGLSIALQSDGKIVVAGYSSNGNDNDFAIARYNGDGTLDTDFGTAGKLTIAIGSGHDYAYSVALQPDNKIILAGTSNNGTDFDFALVRCDDNGELDNSFGTGGKVTTPIGVKNDFAYSVIIQSDTEIVIGGFAFNGTNNDFALARYKTDGSLDSTFGTDGKAITSIGNDYDYLNALAQESDGKIIAAGDFNNGTNFDFALVRYNTNGAPDSSFGLNGIVTTSIGTGYDYGYGVTLQADGKIVMVGSSESGSGNDFAVARYLSDLGTAVIDFSSSVNSEFIYPNPLDKEATLKFNLKNEEVISIRLLNLNGEVLKTYSDYETLEEGIHEQSIELPSSLSSGSYYLTISSLSGGQVTIKIVK